MAKLEREVDQKYVARRQQIAEQRRKDVEDAIERQRRMAQEAEELDMEVFKMEEEH